MNLIQQITADPLQKQTIVIADGTSFDITMYFVPMQYSWFIQELVYGTFTLEGFRIFNSPNMLHQYRNRLPFGLGCYTVGGREPSQQQDFSSAASKIYVLTAAEVAEFESYLTSG